MNLKYSGSHAEVARQKAIASCDPNRILLHHRRGVATKLYYHGLNAVTANKLSDTELLELKGIGRKAIQAIRVAVNTSSRQTHSPTWPFPRVCTFK